MMQGNDSKSVAGRPETLGTQPPVLVAEGIRKSYGSGEAIRGLSFSLQAGRVLAFLGPNGAGKTTSIRILTTILEPTSGHFSVDGISGRYPEKIRRIIGVLPEGLGFPKAVTAIEYLMYFSRLFGRSAAGARTTSLGLLESVGMQNRKDAAIGTFSHGMRQRLGIARALINDPKVVFLDEPTLGLDPRGKQDLLALIRRMARERSAGVVLSSHILSEVEGICDDVVILNAGEVVAQGAVAEVTGRTQENEQGSAIRVRVPQASMAQSEQVLAGRQDVKQVTPMDTMPGWLAVELAAPSDGASSGEHLAVNRILDAIIRAEIPILGFEVVGGRLQDVFLELTAEVIT